MDPQKKHVISDSGPLVPPPTPTTTPLDMHAYAAYVVSQLPASVQAQLHAHIVGDRVIGGEKATIVAGLPNNDVPGIIVLIKHRGVVYSIGAPGGLTPSPDQNAAISSLQFLDTPAVMSPSIAHPSMPGGKNDESVTHHALYRPVGYHVIQCLRRSHNAFSGLYLSQL